MTDDMDEKSADLKVLVEDLRRQKDTLDKKEETLKKALNSLNF